MEEKAINKAFTEFNHFNTKMVIFIYLILFSNQLICSQSSFKGTVMFAHVYDLTGQVIHT